MELVITEVNQPKNTICLNMIVKNEAGIILDTLINLCSYINFDYWVICDTGSTDKTKEIITEYFHHKKIKGELLEHEWRDFAHNRTKALEGAFKKTDYVLIFDADDRIEGNFLLPTIMNKDSYYFKIGTGYSYQRKLLITNKKRWRFKGVLHEYLDEIDNMIRGSDTIEGNYYMISGRFGDRSKNLNKYYDDAIILQNAFEKEMNHINGDKKLAGRYAFYCARSYEDAGQQHYPDSIKWYIKVLESTTICWIQEKYYAGLAVGNLYNKLNDSSNAVRYWIKSSEYDNERIEGIVNAMETLRNKGDHVMVNLLYKKFKNYSKNISSDKLFLDREKYNDLIEYNNSISAFYVSNEKESGYECCKKIIRNNIIGEHLMKSTLSNVMFYKEFIEKDTNSLDLFYLIDDIICKKDNNLNINELWNLLFNINKKYLVSLPSNKINIKKNNKLGVDTKIFISFTTCKRFDLFTQTINSILNHWTDLDKIDYWVCVDDNSSEEDREKMKSAYPWIEYYMKNNSNEKGHRQSMNIIWDKLNELKPDYWIHMEDDFLFHHKTSYIIPSIEFIKTNQNNVKQVLFNRNYAETIEHYRCLGHLPSNNNNNNNNNNNIVLHDHKNGIFNYLNHHYWPHYSFRPAVIDVKTILNLGNYDSDNQFFERDYANKWTDGGYKSAFFNRITCRHIGRLTNDKNGIKNAYQLNEEEQFENIQKKYIQIDTKTYMPSALNKIKLNLDVYCINLDKRTDRLEYLYETVPFQFTRFSAVDGNQLIKYTKNDDTKKLLECKNNQLCVLGEVGCRLSHYLLWKKINTPTIILEDDIMFTSNSLANIEETIRNINIISNDEWDMIYIAGQWTPDYGIESVSYINEQKVKQVDISTKFLHIKGNLYKRFNNSTMNDFWNNPFYRTTAGYILSRKGAEKLIQIIADDMEYFMDTPLDVWLLNIESQKKLIIYDAFNHPFYQGGFDLIEDKRLLESDIIRGKKELLVI
jgi:GR25 family glycosyltransferase involved in LPS biosynthesis